MDEEDRVWVIVETTKAVGQIFSYRGTVSREDLDAWSRGHLQGALTLNQAYWLDEDDAGRLMPIVIGRHGGFRNGTGVLHLAIATVVVVMELRSPDVGVLEGEKAQVLRIGAVRRPRPVREEE
ncbi:MAG: hypothetical protein AAGE52_12380 [Myxococcota bacterium]